MHGRSEDPANGQDTCKLSFQYKMETVLYFLKNLLSRKEFKQAYKLTVKSGSKKGAGDLVNITLDLKPLFAEKNVRIWNLKIFNFESLDFKLLRF